MKLGKGERIVCSRGHHGGAALADVPDGQPIPSDTVSIPGPLLPRLAQGYTCGPCEEVVALRESGGRWSVRTARGWVE